MLDLDPESLRLIVVKMITLILSITVHEFGHAIVADRLGDRLPRHEGRVTLNPVAHADPIGTLAFPALGLLLSGGHTIGFGWGRPVRVNPTSFTRRYRVKTSHMLVALAGPVMNILFGMFISLVLLALVKFQVIAPYGDLFINMINAVVMNFVLAFFNLIPAPPLDGGTVLAGVLPDSARRSYDQFAQYGFFVVMAIIMIPKLSNIFVWPALKLFDLWARQILGLF